jgi:hypothetical protein
MSQALTVVLTILVYLLCVAAIVWLLLTVLQMARALRDITERLDDIERVLTKRDP